VGPRARGENPRERRFHRGACTSRRPSETVCESRFTPSKAWHAHSILSGAARCQVGVAGRPCRSRASLQETRHDGRRLGSFLHSLSVGEDSLPTGEDGGTILVTRVNPTPNALEARGAAATGRLGTEPVVPEDDKDVRGRDDFGEGSSSRRNRRPSARGQHPGRREASPRRMLGHGTGRPTGKLENRVHRDWIGQSRRKRIAALSL